MTIQPAQRTHHIARVSADSKLGHPADIDGDFHGKILSGANDIQF